MIKLLLVSHKLFDKSPVCLEFLNQKESPGTSKKIQQANYAVSKALSSYVAP